MSGESLDPILFQDKGVLTQEERLAVLQSSTKLHIGIPRELFSEENRIALTPSGVKSLVENGHSVVMEKDAGLNSHFTNEMYEDAGAQISSNSDEVLSHSIILKISPPSEKELRKIKPNSTIFSALQINTLSAESLEIIQKKKIVACAYDFLKDYENKYPILEVLEEISGLASVFLAAQFLSSDNCGKGILFGNIYGIPSTKMCIIGTNQAALTAAKHALNLGVSVSIFDKVVSGLRTISTQLSSQIQTGIYNSEMFKSSIRSSDVIVAASNAQNLKDIIISEDLIKQMKPGSVVIDLTLDRGGCVETIELQPKTNPYVKHDVIHYGMYNLPSNYAQTASFGINNVLVPLLMQIGVDGHIEHALRLNEGLRDSVFSYKGLVTNERVARWFKKRYNDIRLLMY